MESFSIYFISQVKTPTRKREIIMETLTNTKLRNVDAKKAYRICLTKTEKENLLSSQESKLDALKFFFLLNPIK